MSNEERKKERKKGSVETLDAHPIEGTLNVIPVATGTKSLDQKIKDVGIIARPTFPCPTIGVYMSLVRPFSVHHRDSTLLSVHARTQAEPDSF